MARSRTLDAAHGYGWTRGPIQFGGGILNGALVPFLIAVLVSPRLLEISQVRHSFVASLAAVMLGYYLYKSVTRFPGIQAGYYIIPIFTSAFAAAITALFMFRLDYSRPLLIASYMLCVAWYCVVYFRLQRKACLSIGVVPFGDVESLGDVGRVSWQRLSTPGKHPQRCRVIVADFHADLPDSWQRHLADAALSGITVLHVKQLRESLTGQVQIEHLSENANGSLVPQPAYIAVKIVVDVVMAAAALIVLCPLLVGVAIVMKLSSRGPVLFRQRRIGYRGVPFHVLKFRTMAPRDLSGASHETIRADAITRTNDQRITPLGRIMRRTRLDELPQLLNICLGQMSFIGPRPEAEILSNWYQQEIPFYRYRHIVRPGITGWAQVNQGHVAAVDEVHRKLHYDFYYISNFSLWLDVLILLRTVRTVITGFGSK